MLKAVMILLLYFAVAASSAIIIKNIFKVPAELMRKILHMIIVMAVFVYVYAFPRWYMAAATSFIFAVIVYPFITMVEKQPLLMTIFNERKNGEIRNSLLLVHIMIAFLLTVFWGWLGESNKYIIVSAVMAWGLGDAAAALVGKKWGKRKIKLNIADRNKTILGTFSMAAVSAIAIAVTLIFNAGKPLSIAFATALVAAPVCAFVELISKGGIDTVTVPLAAAFSIFVAVGAFEFIGLH